MKRTKINALFTMQPQQPVRVMGWVRTFRSQRFIALNDGSSVSNLQIVVDFDKLDKGLLRRITTGACIAVEGRLIPSLGRGQAVEVACDTLEILGDSDAQHYPLQPKRHSLEFLREIAHLRPRTATFGAIMRIRHAMAYATHHFFQERGFYHIHTPIITGLDAEGAGELFRVTTLDADCPPHDEHGHVDYTRDFFGKETSLTVSGQLEAEACALALGETYTFGPTFRAENSNTTRHLAEFWMIEPEMAFYDLSDTMQLAQHFLQYMMQYALKHCATELDLLDKQLCEEDKRLPLNQRQPMGLIERITFVAENDFERMTYTEAIALLRGSKANRKKKFAYPVDVWGVELQSEHERFLVEQHTKKPVIIYDYPRDIKAFYMRRNDDGKTVAAMDVLFPGMGEVVGGSQREERYDMLLACMRERGISEKPMEWYLALRRFGSAPHSGFGVGFERLLLFVTGMTNIRDVIPFPRFPGHAAF